MTQRLAKQRDALTLPAERPKRKSLLRTLPSLNLEGPSSAPEQRYFLRGRQQQQGSLGDATALPVAGRLDKFSPPQTISRPITKPSANATSDTPSIPPSLSLVPSYQVPIHPDEVVISLSAWSRYYGYDTKLESENNSETASEMEATSSIVESSAPPTIATRALSQAKKPKPVDARNPHFYNGLLERNIDFDPTIDQERQWLEKVLKLKSKSVKSTKQQEECWKADLDHCKQSDEAMFQRTAMMEMLDRHQLNDSLNYICETSWTCTRMPRAKPEGAAELVQPKPDLAVAFHTRSLVTQGDLRSLKHLKGFICPEASREKKDTRSFHFFAMEAKGVDVDKAKSVAHRQNFNTASQALHNMYEIMRRAGDEAIFFEKVRFFTVIATAELFEVRVHRAAKIDEPRNFINPDYPLEFKFDEFLLVEKHEYSRSRILGIVHNILFEYGVQKLHAILKAAISKILQNLADEVKASRKRPAEELLESFGSSRTRLSALDMGNQQAQVSQVQLTA